MGRSHGIVDSPPADRTGTPVVTRAARAGYGGAGPEKWSSDDEYRKLMGTALVAALIVVIGVVCAAGQSAAAKSIGIILVTAATGAIAGAAVGFLFGIPRVLSDPPAPPAPAVPPADTQSPGQVAGGTPPKRLLATNSNLEQVSDWLTKIILGVGLTQFYEIDDALFRFERLVGRFVGAQGGLTPLIATVVLVFAVIAGFLTMYLETRLVLSRIFNSVEFILGDLAAERDAALEGKRQSDEIASGLQTSLKSVATSAQASPELRSIATQALAASGHTEPADDPEPMAE